MAGIDLWVSQQGFQQVQITGQPAIHFPVAQHPLGPGCDIQHAKLSLEISLRWHSANDA